MSHLILVYTVCHLVFEFSIRYSLDLMFFENWQTKILSSAFLVIKELKHKEEEVLAVAPCYALGAVAPCYASGILLMYSFKAFT